MRRNAEVDAEAEVVALQVQHVGQRVAHMHARQHRCAVVHASAHQREMQAAMQRIAPGKQPERAESGLRFRFVHAHDGLLGSQAMADQVGDAADLQSVFLREGLQFGAARHRAVLVQDFDQHAGRLEPGQRREIARGFGMAGARQHAARLRRQREHVARLHQIIGLRIGGDRHLDGARAIVRGDAGGHAARRLDRNGEVGVVRGTVVAHHRAQAELRGTSLVECEADQPARLARHEVDVFRPHALRGHDQVAFVLAILVVEHDDHAPGTQFVEHFGNGGERHEVVSGER